MNSSFIPDLFNDETFEVNNPTVARPRNELTLNHCVFVYWVKGESDAMTISNCCKGVGTMSPWNCGR